MKKDALVWKGFIFPAMEDGIEGLPISRTEYDQMPWEEKTKLWERSFSSSIHAFMQKAVGSWWDWSKVRITIEILGDNDESVQ